MGRRSKALDPLPETNMYIWFCKGRRIKQIAYLVGCSYDWAREIIIKKLSEHGKDIRIVTYNRERRHRR